MPIELGCKAAELHSALGGARLPHASLGDTTYLNWNDLLVTVNLPGIVEPSRPPGSNTEWDYE
jgi:hypothetical protein